LSSHLQGKHQYFLKRLAKFHWAIETADLIVLCYELLLLEELNIDDVFDRCIPRFDVKLKRLVKNVS